jgi:dienelactone hydrolase
MVRLIALLVLLLLPVVATAEVTIKKGYVSKRSPKAGLLLYLHDCYKPKFMKSQYKKYGFLREWIRHFERSGLKVYAPDSFAEKRPGPNCRYADQVKRTTIKKRTAQTENALRAIRKKYPDTPIYIWGQGEGGLVAMKLTQSFAGVVTSGVACGGDRKSKVLLPRDTPLMMMVGNPAYDPHVEGRLEFQYSKTVEESCDLAVESYVWHWREFEDVGHYFPVWSAPVREAMAKAIPVNRDYHGLSPVLEKNPLSKIRPSKPFLKAFKTKYRKYESVKAIAVSNNGYWGYGWGYPGAVDAKLNALYWCAVSQKQKGRRIKPCVIYAVGEKVVHTALTRALVKRVQQALKGEGYDPGPIDGAWGNKSRIAMNSYLETVGLTPRKSIDLEALQALDLAE